VPGRHHAGGLELRDLPALQRDPGVARHALVHRLRERHPVHGEGGAARHARGVRRREHDAPEPPHLGLEQAVRVRQFDRFEGVAADELGQPVGLVRGRGAVGPHLVERDGNAALGQRPGGLAPREPAADHGRA